MLVFSAIVPHSPILLPSIGKDNLKKLKKTVQALEDLEAKLYITKPDAILMFSPHGDSHEDTTTFLLDDTYLVNFREFGDFATNLSFRSTPQLIERFRRVFHAKAWTSVIQHERPLDYGFGVPLTYLTKNLPNVKLMPILPPHNEPLKKQFDIGYALKDVIMNEQTRVAVIASSDLSHKLSSDSPAGFSPKAKEFDDELVKLLESKNSVKILQMHHEEMDEVEICGMRSIAMFLGIMDRVSTTTQVFSYEAPLGVGYLVANFKLS